MYLTKKKISGKEYYYARESVRKGKKVISKNIAYLGADKKKAEEKMREIVNNKEREKNNVRITYFVHGTTLDNEKEISSGWKDVELSEKGIKQSKELVKQINGKKFDVIFTSDLKRAVKSSEITFGKGKIIIDKRLRECNYGDYDGKESEIVEPMQEKSIEKRFPNGESYEDVKKRIKEFLNDIFNKYKGKHIAIVAHKAPQLAMEVLLNNKTWEEAFRDDWRKRKAWQPGWEYFINHRLEDSIMKEQKETQIPEKQKTKKLTIEDLASFCKRKGFVFRSSDIYGGFSGFWDFGHLGVDLFNNIRKEFWNFFVEGRDDMEGIESSVISHPRTWKASGHITSFKDIAVVCKKCKKATKIDASEEGKVKCACGGEYEKQGEFNLLFKTKVGALDSEDAYLRGETAQGMFMNFKLVMETARQKLPFGIAQIGRCFRNEIAPRDFLFRSREFHIGEFEFFIHPEETKCDKLEKKHLELKINLLDAETQGEGGQELKETTIGKMIKEKRLGEWHGYWLAEQIIFLTKIMGLDEDKIKVREHTKDELSHYSSATFDLDYLYPFGSLEVAGNANRGQYDLTQHEKESKQSMEIYDEKTKKKVKPRVIEPTFGMERIFLAVLVNSYNYDEKRENIVLKIPKKLAPYKAAILPLVKNEEKLVKLSREIYDELRLDFHISYDAGGSVGRRYSRQDEIGTPYCITIDSDSLKDKAVTIRDRDTTKQIRVKIKDIRNILRRLISDGEELLKVGKKVDTRVKEQ